MARVLIGWELGGGRGHMQSMLAIAHALTARGHQVALAVQRLDAATDPLPAGATLLQAPLWPRLVVGAPDVPRHAPVTLIDILARLGLDRPGTLTAMLAAWDGIIAAFAPRLAIGDFAPALIAAAHGRVPAVAVGPGFQTPPDDTAQVARLGGGEPGYDEAAMHDLIDADLRAAGREPLPALPALFRCDRRLIASIPELDPYGRPDGPDHVPPAVGEWSAPAPKRGDEVFVYAHGPIERFDAFWQGLVATGLPIRAHVPLAPPALRDAIARRGVIVERRPIPWPLIAARSRIAVNHGAHGTMCGLLLAGLPQLALPIDLEKRLHSDALARAGLGHSLPASNLPPERLTEAVLALAADTKLAARVRRAAPRFARRMIQPYGEAVADAVASLI